MKQCPACRSTRIENGLLSDGFYFSLRGPRRSVWPWRNMVAIEAILCLDCGHIAMVAKDLDKVRSRLGEGG